MAIGIGARSRLLIAVCFVSLEPMAARALCTPREAPVIADPKAYASAYVDALIALHSALSHTQEVKTAKMPSDTIVSFTKTEDGIECANSYLKDYQSSPIKAVQASAQSFGVAMDDLGESVEGFRQEYNALLDGKREKPSEHAELVAALTVKDDDAWHFEMNATISLGLALIEFDKQNKQHFVLTSAERDALVRTLESTFGNLAHAKGTLPGLESSVSVFLEFLTDKDRKTVDAR